MGEFTTLMARDGHHFRAWLAGPGTRPRGAVVVVQEIFGVNSHIRAVTEDYAAQGYVAIAPSLFDRVRRGIELGYSPKERQEGLGYVQQIRTEDLMRDLAAAIAVVRHAGRVGLVGFCWGGRIAYMAATNPDLPLAAAVSYYGGGIVKLLDRKPRIPVMYHFGELDQHIPAEDIEKIQAAHPEGIFYTYPQAGHGFNCDQRDSYHAESAALARTRTLEFFAERLTGEPPKESDS